DVESQGGLPHPLVAVDLDDAPARPPEPGPANRPGVLVGLPGDQVVELLPAALDRADVLGARPVGDRGEHLAVVLLLQLRAQRVELLVARPRLGLLLAGARRRGGDVLRPEGAYGRGQGVSLGLRHGRPQSSRRRRFSARRDFLTWTGRSSSSSSSSSSSRSSSRSSSSSSSSSSSRDLRRRSSSSSLDRRRRLRPSSSSLRSLSTSMPFSMATNSSTEMTLPTAASRSCSASLIVSHASEMSGPSAAYTLYSMLRRRRPRLLPPLSTFLMFIHVPLFGLVKSPTLLSSPT